MVGELLGCWAVGLWGCLAAGLLGCWAVAAGCSVGLLGLGCSTNRVGQLSGRRFLEVFRQSTNSAKRANTLDVDSLLGDQVQIDWVNGGRGFSFFVFVGSCLAVDCRKKEEEKKTKQKTNKTKKTAFCASKGGFFFGFAERSASPG